MSDPGRHTTPERTPTPRWAKQFALGLAVLAAAFVILHLTGHGMGAHLHGGR